MSKKATPPKTLSDKIDHLFTVVHPPKGEYTHEQVATAIEAAGGPTISATYLWQLRKGQRDNPTMKHLQALSGFFGVPPAYFFDEAAAIEIDAELRLLTAMRDEQVREIANLAMGLSLETLEIFAAVVKRMRQLEGLD